MATANIAMKVFSLMRKRLKAAVLCCRSQLNLFTLSRKFLLHGGDLGQITGQRALA
jgi:hypothetical protein